MALTSSEVRALPGPYTRTPSWIDGLARELRESRDRPFQWGKNDCLQFAGRIVEAMTGVNPLLPHLGRYCSPVGALEVLRRDEGVRLPIDLADKLWGPRQHVAMARMGDLVAADLGQPAAMGMSVGVCYGRSSLFTGVHGDEVGLVRLDTLKLEHCYQPWASS